jgi:hypothetical protein
MVLESNLTPTKGLIFDKLESAVVIEANQAEQG